MKQASAAGALLAALAVCGPAHADETPDDDGALALLAGGAVSLASLTAGGLMIARSDYEPTRSAGLLVAQSGMVFSPLVAHGVVGEWKRGLWFSLPLLVPLATSSVFIGLHPTMIRRAPAGIQYMTWAGATLSLVASTIGIIDAVLVRDRRPRATQSASFSLVPWLGDHTTGAMIAGSL